METFNINDNYFKYQKCLSGITYQYVNNLDDIYDKNLMVGTNYCIYCMYNEFDIIDNFMVNLNVIDICSTIHIDLTKRYFQMDNEFLRTGHKVLLVNQNDPIENDIYVVNSNGFLILSDDLSTPEKVWRYKAYVKMGDNKYKQFHLKNSGNRFPIKGERKYFIDAHGYIIKSVFNYDLFDTGPITPKIIFTDYELARLSLNKNYELYNGFNMPTLAANDSVNIKYHDNDYIIYINNDTNEYVYSGITSNSTIYNFNDYPVDGLGYQTIVKVNSDFLSNAQVYDYVKLQLSGSTNLSLKSFIKKIGSTYIVLSDYIPDNILNDVYNSTSPVEYTITNLMYSEDNNIKNILLESFYSKCFNIDSDNYIYPIENQSDLYFDYDGIKFVFSGSTTQTNIFQTDNYYIDYKLYEHLNVINPYLFNSAYTFLIDKTINSSEFTMNYYDEREIPNTTIYPETLGDTKGTLIKVTPRSLSDLNYFKKHTYLNIVTSNNKYKTLIVDIVPGQYLIIETYKSNSGVTFENISLQTICNLKEISDILYDVYLNEETSFNYDYYRVRDDDMRKNICNGYASFISEDVGIIEYTTAFLMQDEKHKFVLKIYDPENTSNGGSKRVPYVLTKSGCKPHSTSAELPGEIIEDGGTNITERGILYSNSPIIQNITLISDITDTYYGEYTCNATGLGPETNYWYKAFARNNEGISYGDVYSFKTLEPVYTGATVVINSVKTESHSIKIKSEIIDAGYSTITSRGILFKIGTTAPTLSDDVIIYTPESGEIGLFEIDLVNLDHDTYYSYNAFAINVCGTTYASSGTTKTLYPSPPVVRTDGHGVITYNRADLLFTILSNDGSLTDPIHGVDQSGIVWTDDYNSPPTVSGPNIYPYPTPYYLNQQYNINLTGLTYNTAYYYRAYAWNSLYSGANASYGHILNFTTLSLPIAPNIFMVGVTSYSTTTANVSINVIDNGGSDITSMGLYYSTGSTVTSGDTYISTASTTSWSCLITGLTALTQYSIMGQASNDFGTGYTSITGFTTLPVQTIPVVTIEFITSGDTTATLSCSITSDGYSSISSKGVSYSGSTMSGWEDIPSSSSSSSWIEELTGLDPISNYWAKSYAINAIGGGYSDVISWVTQTGYFAPVFSSNSPNISSSSTGAVIINDIINDGGASILSRGLKYSGSTMSGWVDILDPVQSTGIYTTYLSNLDFNTTYWVYGYASNSEGETTTDISSFNTLSAELPTVETVLVEEIDMNTILITSIVNSEGDFNVTSRGFYLTGSTDDVWLDDGVGLGKYPSMLTGLTAGGSYTGRSFAISLAGVGLGELQYFQTTPLNNVTLDMTITSISNESANPLIYQVGCSVNDIVTTVNVDRGNLPLNLLIEGNTQFSAAPLYGSPDTGLTWGAGIITANNSNNPYTYSPVQEESQYFTAVQKCGSPVENKTTTREIKAVYPYLTSNRSVVSRGPQSPMPTEKELRSWAKEGLFYTGAVPPNNEYMLKKIELKSYKSYHYNIGKFDNMIAFAYPASYGLLASIIVNGGLVPPIGPGSATTYVNVEMSSIDLVNDWTHLYHVYIFTVEASLGNIFIEYNY